MNKIQAMKALISGKKVRGKEWMKGQYVYIKDDIIVNQNNEPDYRFDTWIWEEFQEMVDWNFEAGEIIKCDYNSTDFIFYKIVYFCDRYIVAEPIDMDSIFPFIFLRTAAENKYFSIEKV